MVMTMTMTMMMMMMMTMTMRMTMIMGMMMMMMRIRMRMMMMMIHANDDAQLFDWIGCAKKTREISAMQPVVINSLCLFACFKVSG